MDAVSEIKGFAPSSFCGTGDTGKSGGCLPRFTFRGWTYVGVCALENQAAFWCYSKNGKWDFCNQDCQDQKMGNPHFIFFSAGHVNPPVGN